MPTTTTKEAPSRRYRQHPERRKDKRGSNRDRRFRKEYLLEKHGNGRTCPCTHCGCKLTYTTLQVDRIIPGGSYRRDNIQPSCADCNLARGDNPDWRGALAAAVA